MKAEEFYESVDSCVWRFASSRDVKQVRELQVLRGKGWSKYSLTSPACTLTVMISGEGIGMTGVTDLNPTVRELDFYDFDADDDVNEVCETLETFLEQLWDVSMKKVRHTRLFGVSWPNIK